jgi:DMSO reductase anchor subunit
MASPSIGFLTLIACIALFVCTGMIYACLKFLQEWASPLTLVNFFLLGAASGTTLAAALAAWLAPVATGLYARSAIALTLVALAGRVASLARNARLRPRSSLQTAIGIKHPRIVQKAQGFMGGSFNTREFFHGASKEKLRAIKWGFLLLTFPVPLLLLLAGLGSGVRAAYGLAFCMQYAGLLAERWYFFAQANHPQNLYYQAIS